MELFFSVGEPSGDLHGANLIRALQSRGAVRCVGLGGPRMAEAGCDLHADLTQSAVMGFLPVVKHIPRLLGILRRADRYFREHRPDAVVLIDYPGFNWWIARRAKRHGIPVFYYGAPQIWAWARWRVEKMRRLTDHVLCKLPFEADWYRQHGCHATYVGHPYFDEVARQRVSSPLVAELASAPGPLVGLLPGSRTHEVTSNLPQLLSAARIVRQSVPEARFAVASFSDKQAAIAESIARASDVAVTIHAGKTPEIMRASQCCLACSGSVSLELLHHAKPFAVLYRVHPLTYFLCRSMVKVKYITLVNLLATDNPFSDRLSYYDRSAPEAAAIPVPEYATAGDRSQDLAAHVVEWLTDEEARSQKVAQLESLRQRFGQSGASRVAAAYILQALSHPSAAGVPPADCHVQENADSIRGSDSTTHRVDGGSSPPAPRLGKQDKSRDKSCSHARQERGGA